MRTPRTGKTTWRGRVGRWARPVFLALPLLSMIAVATVIAAAPAGAAPTISATGTTDVVTGTTITVSIDGAGGYDGAAMLAVTGCGNATATGVPLASVTPDDCWSVSEFDHVALIFGLTDGTDYTIDYTWAHQGIGINDTTCIAGGIIDCTLAVSLVGADLDPFSTTEIPVFALVPGSNPLIVAGLTTVTEGTGGTTIAAIPVTLSEPSPAPVSAEWTLYDGSATAPHDYVAATGTIVFAPGETSATIDTEVVGDRADEFDERFFVFLSHPTNGRIGGYFGLGAVDIIDDDPAPRVIPGWTVVSEGDAGRSIARIPVRLSAPSARAITVDWQTRSHTATSGTDFEAASGQLRFAPGETEIVIEVDILGDTDAEPPELFLVSTSNWVNARPGGLWGIGGVGILDDDTDCTPRLAPGADLRGCSFAGQTIADISLVGADLTWADFSGADLRAVDLSQATLDGAAFTNATIASSSLDQASAVGADFDGADLADVTVEGATFDRSTIRSAEFLVVFPDNTSFTGVTWGDSTTCPDLTTSGHHGNTCRRVPVVFRSAGEPLEYDPVETTDAAFYATFHPTALFDPTTLTDASVFGVPFAGIAAQQSYVSDSDGGGEPDRTYEYPVDGAPLTEGILTYCAHAANASGDAVYGCNQLTVITTPVPTTTVPTTTGPPLSPPMSPSISPNTSPPISGLDGSLAGLLPFLAGPVGLMATASGLGMIFLIGARRATILLEGDAREDDLADDD